MNKTIPESLLVDDALSDDGLVNFLQTYSPTPPSETKPCEELVMRNIAQEQRNAAVKSKTDIKKKLLWLLPLAIISGAVMISSNLFRSTLSPQVASELEEIDKFMVDAWQGSMAQESESEQNLYMLVTSEY